jgi:hypothetical protein
MYTAPYGVFAIDDYEAKYYTLLRLAAGQNISCIVTVNPSTIVLLADRLARYTDSIIRDVRDGSLSHDFTVPAALRESLTLRPDPDRARHLERAAGTGDGLLRPGLAWPNIAAIGCWKGGTVGSYLAKFDTYFPQGPAVRDLGYYATELRGSVPLSDQGDAGAIAVAVAVATNVLEFHPADDENAPEGRELLPVERLEVGQCATRRWNRCGSGGPGDAFVRVVAGDQGHGAAVVAAQPGDDGGQHAGQLRADQQQPFLVALGRDDLQ